MEKRTERRRDGDEGGRRNGVDNKLGSAVYVRRVCIKSLQIRRSLGERLSGMQKRTMTRETPKGGGGGVGGRDEGVRAG